MPSMRMASSVTSDPPAMPQAPQALAAHAQAGERHSVGRLNNLQTFHRPVDTIGKPQDLNPPAD